MNIESVQRWLFDKLNRKILPDTACPVSGGCINEAFLVQDDQGNNIFLKSNEPFQITLFETEIKSLKLLRDAKAIRVPEPFCSGIVEGRAMLAIEGLTLVINTDAADQKKLGRKIAGLHSHQSPDGRFGADFNNYIGATPQFNSWKELWTEFFITQRLDYQFDLAERKGLTFRRRKKFTEAASRFLDGCEVSASTLHGDLWGGNVSFDQHGAPVTYDPAAYFGDRETDIAFTRMFGGFAPGFYSSYREVFPEPEDIEIRHRIYNLYHLLNHFNLFGGDYGAQARSLIREVVKEIR